MFIWKYSFEFVSKTFYLTHTWLEILIYVNFSKLSLKSVLFLKQLFLYQK